MEKKKKKMNKMWCNLKVCGGDFPEICFQAHSSVRKYSLSATEGQSSQGGVEESGSCS